MDSNNFYPQDYFEVNLKENEVETLVELNNEISSLQNISDLNEVNNLLLINRVVAKLYGTKAENTFSEHLPIIVDQINNAGYNITKEGLVQIFSHIQGICNNLYLYTYSQISYLNYHDLIDQYGIDDKLKTVVDNYVWRSLSFQSDDPKNEAIRIYLSIRASIKHVNGEISEDSHKLYHYLEEDEDKDPDEKTLSILRKGYSRLIYKSSQSYISTSMDTLQHLVITEGISYLEQEILTLQPYEQIALLYQLGVFELYGNPKTLRRQWGLSIEKRRRFLYQAAKKLYQNRYKVKRSFEEVGSDKPSNLFQLAQSFIDFKPLRANNGVLDEQGLRVTIVNMPYESIKGRFTNKQKEVILLAKQNNEGKIIYTVDQIASLTNLLPATVKSIIDTVVSIYKEDRTVYVYDNDTVIDKGSTQYKLIALSKNGFAPYKLSVLTPEEVELFSLFTTPGSDERYLYKHTMVSEDNKRKKLRSIYKKLTDSKYQEAIDSLSTLLEIICNLTLVFHPKEIEIFELLRTKLERGESMGGITSVWGLGRLSTQLGYSQDYLSGLLTKARKVAMNS